VALGTARDMEKPTILLFVVKLRNIGYRVPVGEAGMATDENLIALRRGVRKEATFYLIRL
jgi:hypothetical protein